MGKSNQMNSIRGAASAIRVTNNEMATLAVILSKGLLCYNEDTGELKVGDGVSPVISLPDHQHNQFAKSAHSHLYGTNDPWLVSNPKLWFIPDLVNHPELVRLDGSEIDAETAEYISQVYSGDQLATTPLNSLGPNGFENEDLYLTTTSFKAIQPSSAMFNEPLSIENCFNTADQWLAASSDLSIDQDITISFRGGHTYRPTSYHMSPAVGTSDAVSKIRPTPNSWVVEGSNDKETWTLLDTQTNITSEQWNIFQFNSFDIDDLSSTFVHLRIRITEWNSTDETLEPGLKRLYIYGRKNNVFALPDIESPNPDFVWVIPKKNLNVGLKHEDVGDMGITNATANNLGTHRLLTDGSSYLKSSYDVLFNTIGYNNDKETVAINLETNNGTITDDINWTSSTATTVTDAFLEFEIADGNIIGALKMAVNINAPKPMAWELQANTSMVDEGTWDSISVSLGTPIWITVGARDEFRFNLDISVPDKSYLRYKLIITEWSNDAGTIGLDEVIPYTHVKDEFYVPYKTVNDNETSYIVSRQNTTDVTPSIIQALQQNIINLSTALATLQNQVNEIDPNI